jgi:hypothetical protein
MNLRERIVAEIATGPGTCSELAVELKQPQRVIGATLQQLHAAGRLDRDEPVSLYGHIRPVHIYRIPEQPK